MGRIKIPFPNGADLYLHDTPNKDLFAQDDRKLSHGCIRLQDAERLGRWLMGRDPADRIAAIRSKTCCCRRPCRSTSPISPRR